MHRDISSIILLILLIYFCSYQYISLFTNQNTYVAFEAIHTPPLMKPLHHFLMCTGISIVSSYLPSNLFSYQFISLFRSQNTALAFASIPAPPWRRFLATFFNCAQGYLLYHCKYHLNLCFYHYTSYVIQ